MCTATAQGVIGMLHANFALFGIPEHIVTDDKSQFTSQEFKIFLKRNGILHTLTAPGHPATNGLPEKYVRHLTSKLNSLKMEDDLPRALYRFLFSYRTTPTALVYANHPRSY